MINMLAPASSTKDAAICVTAKMRWRRLVLLVTRTLPLARFMPFDALAEGRRGTNAKITAAMMASATPTQSMLESTVKSSARTEKREAYRARMVTSGCAMITPMIAPAPQSSRLSASNMRRSAPVLAPERGTNREFAFAANGARENQVGHVRAGDDEDQAGGSEQHQQNGARAGSNLVAEHPGINAVAGVIGIRIGMVLHHGGVHRAQFGARLVESGAGSKLAEEFGHAMDAAGDHGGGKMMRAGDQVADDLRFGGIRHGGFQDADDRGGTIANAAEANGFADHVGILVCKRWTRSDRSAR